MASTTLARPASAPEADAAPPATLAVPADVRLIVDAEGFAALCAANRDMRLEREADGGLIVMAPASPDSGGRNAELIVQVGIWNKAHGHGRVFDSSAGFTLPDSSVCAPDVSWMSRDRWDALPRSERLKFSRIVPDFVAELRSSSDAIKDLRAKMAQYIAQSVRLAWTIDPLTQTVEIHRPGREVETLAKPTTLDGEDVLPGFTLDLKGILFD